MELQEYGSPIDEAWCDSLWSIPESEMQQEKSADWTFEENKLFENALAKTISGSDGFFEKVATSIPSKTMEHIKMHYQALVEDIELIESGGIPIPNYPSDVNDQKMQTDTQEGYNGKKEKGSTSRVKAKGTSSAPQRKKGKPWTEQEHQLFLMGLQQYGRGDWRSISRFCVISRTPTQVASHAQKYFRRQTTSTPVERRRPSIHDIHPISPYPTAFTDPGPSVQWDGNCSVNLPNVGEQIAPLP